MLRPINLLFLTVVPFSQLFHSFYRQYKQHFFFFCQHPSQLSNVMCTILAHLPLIELLKSFARSIFSCPPNSQMQNIPNRSNKLHFFPPGKDALRDFFLVCTAILRITKRRYIAELITNLFYYLFEPICSFHIDHSAGTVAN